MANTPAVRGLRDEAAVGPSPSDARDLKRLSELRYEVADGEPDIRGWTVYASTGREVGIVSDLLVDTDAGEVVMLDVDLRRHNQHTLAPIRAAWVDHATRRVVLDARALAGALGTPASAPAALTAPALPSPESAPRGADAIASEAEPSFPALPRSGPLSDADIQRFDQEYVRTYGDRAADPNSAWRVTRGTDEALQFAPRRLIEPDTTAADRRASRVDDASTLDAAAGIDPRELDARVRIEEGATVDDAAPVAGVRYEGEEHTPHDYGRPDEAYGPEHGSGRIGFNRVVSRQPYAGETPGSDDNPADTSPASGGRAVRYRQYDDRYAGPGERQ